jgi:hypothetical protein
MKRSLLISSALLTGCLSLSQIASPVLANTKTGTDGYIPGSGIAPINIPSTSTSSTIPAAILAAAAAASNTSIATSNAIIAGNTKDLGPQQGISILAPEVASIGGVSTSGSTEIAVVLKDASGTPTQQKFSTNNPQTAAKVTATLSGVLAGLEKLNASPASIQQAVGLTALLANISNFDAISPSDLSSQIVTLLATLQLANEKDANSVNAAILAYNTMIKSSNIAVLTALKDQPQFQAVRQQLTTLRSAFK